MGASGFEQRLARLATTQYGVVSRAQLRDLGMSDAMIKRRLASGALARCMPRVFRVTAAPETWPGRLIAVCLSIGHQVWVSHRAAAAFWRLEGSEKEIVEVTTCRRVQSQVGVVLHRTRTLPARDATIVRKIPVTTVHRTLIDLGAVASEEDVELALECALRRRITSVQVLLRRIDMMESRGRKGAGVLRELIAQRPADSPATESALETKVMQLLRRHRLPEPVRQLVVRDEEGFIARVDLAYPAARLLIEVDSRRHHLRRRQWEADLARRNELTSRDWRVLHMTDEKLRHHPNSFLACVRRALQGEAVREMGA